MTVFVSPWLVKADCAIRCPKEDNLLHQVICQWPPGRSKCPTTPLFSMLCLFLEFPVSVVHHVLHELLPRPSSSPPFCPPLSLSLQRVTSYNVSCPVLPSCSN